MNGSVPEEAGKVATTTIEALKQQPGLLFLTLVNLAFLVFVYFLGVLVLDAYNKQQTQIHERYSAALVTINRCVDAALGHLENIAKQTQAERTGH